MTADARSERWAMVLASNRQPHIQHFLAAWQTAPGRWPWDVSVIVEDGPSRSFDLPAGAAHYSWEEIRSDPRVQDPAIFSRRDSAIKCYGLYRAVVDHGADRLLVLDDDCLPDGPGGPAAYRDTLAGRLGPTPRWQPSVPGDPTRGVPYLNTGVGPEVAVHMMHWREVADFDGPQSLHRMRAGDPWDVPLPAGPILAHPDCYYPFCGMAFAAAADAVPLLYFPRQGEGVPYRRFDDIWAGVLLQRGLRHLGRSWTFGAPHIRHVRASDPFVNTEKEAPGIHDNERFWERVEAIPLGPQHDTPGRVARAMADGLAAEPTDTRLGAYLAQLGAALADWCEILNV